MLQELKTIAEPKHSGVGIASFITSIFSGVFLFLLVLVAGVIESSSPDGMPEESPAAVVIGLCAIMFLIVSLIALGLGIGGLIQKDRKKIFAVLGTVFSALSIFLFLVCLLAGLAASA